MGKTILFIATILLVFCIVPLSTTQAMPQQAHGKDNVASSLPNAALHASNQKDLRDIDMELNNPVRKENVLTYDIQELRTITIARNNVSTTTRSTVHRSGSGRSTMGDNATEKHGENEEDQDAEDEEFGDDSAVDYNKGLKNTSGYNEDL